MGKIMTNATLSIVLMMYLFVLLGHWLGMLWFNIAIRPLMHGTLVRWAC